MKAKATALLLADLGVTRSHTSNDNPFSEAHFKTLKYQPRFPQRFGCIEDARGFCRRFFDWHDGDHHHAGIGLMTPDQVHYGQADAVHAARQQTLALALRTNNVLSQASLLRPYSAMSSQLSAQAITARTAITSTSIRRWYLPSLLSALKGDS